MSPLQLLALMVVACLWPVSVSAQEATPPTPRGTIAIDGSYQLSSQSFRDAADVTMNAENGSVSSTYDSAGGFSLSGSAAVYLWKRLGAGVSFSRVSSSPSAAIDAALPHPFFFARPRQVSGATDLERVESTIAVTARAFLPVSRRMSLSVFGGPAWISLNQDLVRDVDYAESYPYDTAMFERAVLGKESATGLGLLIGGDFSFYLSRQVGLGATFGYSAATVEMPSFDGGALDVKAGGINIGGGLRVRF